MMIAMMRKLGENQFVGDDERGEVFHHFSTPVRPRSTLTQVTKCFVHGLCYKVLRGHLSTHSRKRVLKLHTCLTTFVVWLKPSVYEGNFCKMWYL